MIAISSDNVVTATITNTTTGNAISNATVTGDLLKDGASLSAFTMANAGSGTYTYTLPASLTTTLTEGSYLVRVKAVTSVGTSVFQISRFSGYAE